MEKLDSILVVDFGGQYAHLICRRFRDLEVYSELIPADVTADEVEHWDSKLEPRGVVLSGGPLSVYCEGAPRLKFNPLELDIPVLGLCYGHQLIAMLAGGLVKRGDKGEFGIAYARIVSPEDILDGLSDVEKVWMSHSDVVCSLPEDFKVLAYTDASPIAAFKHKAKPVYGLQWHPEVAHTERGLKVLENFAFKVCRCKRSWRMEDFVERAVDEVKRTVGGGKCIMALSGGVDSSTTAAIVNKAIGRRLTAVFIDHGLMRDGEPEQVEQMFKQLGLNLLTVKAKERFLSKLKGVTDPEEKRRRIGEEFIRVFEEVAEAVGAEYLAQGTIYPDRVESGFRRYTDKIKTHHNVGGLPLRMKFKGVVEPLRDLYKDEVRRVAKMLGLPDAVVLRQPFPGPGLAVRIVGEVTEEKISTLRRADKIVAEEFEKAGLSGNLWQYFAVLLSDKTTGVKGDRRVYGNVIAIRAVESKEAMTANFARIPYEVLERVSTRITNEIPSVVRVVYDVTHKPPATIEWE